MRWLAVVVAVASAPIVEAQQVSAIDGKSDAVLYPRGPNALTAADRARAASLPGNSWRTILERPRLMGGSWSAGARGLARKFAFDHLEFPPLKPEYLAKSRAQVQKIVDGTAEILDAACRPWGMPRLVYYAGAITFMEQPGMVAIFSNQPRQVYMDGRPHPPELSDPNALTKPSTIGDSRGRWEGNTLVVDTIGIDPSVQIYYGVPNGGGMHIIERYTVNGPDSLSLEMTVDAPMVLERPWIYREQYVRQADASVTGDECDPALVRQKLDLDGNVELDLTPPK